MSDEGLEIDSRGPNEPEEPWFPRMRPYIQGEEFQIPFWPQANGPIVEFPLFRGKRLAAWLLSKDA